jgi:hypothetical protein
MLLNPNAESNTITGCIDKYDLSTTPTRRYWFELKKLPIFNSIIADFEMQNHVRNSEFSVYYITDKNINGEVIEDDIKYINYTSYFINDYAKCLLNTSFIENGKIVNINADNYLFYKNRLIDKAFIDFSLSEQICSILDTVDLNGSRVCSYFTITYFYQV